MGFLGDIGSFIGGGVKGLLTGGPIGAVTGAVGSLVKKGGGGATPVPVQNQGMSIVAPSPVGIGYNEAGLFGGGAGLFGFGPGPTSAMSGFQGAVPDPGIGGAISRFLPGGSTGYSSAPAGFHVNKAYARYLRAKQLGHHVQDPSSAKRMVNVVVKNRRMNPLNPRALRHALRRTHAFVGLARRSLAGSGYTIKRTGLGHGGKRRRKR